MVEEKYNKINLIYVSLVILYIFNILKLCKNEINYFFFTFYENARKIYSNLFGVVQGRRTITRSRQNLVWQQLRS